MSLLCRSAFALLLGSVSSVAIANPVPDESQDSAAPSGDGAGDSVSSSSSPSTGIDEIVVTVRRRSESLLSVPVAVNAIGPAALQRAGAVNLSTIGTLAPQVSFVRANSGAGAIFTIRGLGSNFQDAGVEQTVAVSIDGAQVGRGAIVNSAFFDLDQVEILKGPQALFFGKNSPAGVVSIRSKNPGDELEGYARAGYEFEARER